MDSELTLVVCQNLEREVRHIVEKQRWNVNIHVCAPLCLRPCESTSIKKLSETNQDQTKILAVGCGLLRAQVESSSDRSLPVHSENLEMALCIELFAGKGQIERWRREGAFLITPGWLARWRDNIRKWGFEQPVAREFFAESSLHLLLLDTGVDPQCQENLSDFSEFLARSSQIVPVDLDYFQLYLERFILQRQLNQQQIKNSDALNESQRKLADYAMSYDFIGRLTGMKSETQVIQNILELFNMLFAPASIVYLRIKDSKPGQVYCHPASLQPDQAVIAELAGINCDYITIAGNHGFILRVGEQDTTVGVIKLEGFAFPQYCQHYLNLGLNLIRVCCLAIRNSRIYEDLQRTVDQLQEAIANIKTLSGIIPICAGCKKIRNDQGYWDQVEIYVQKHSLAKFSHGLCPICIKKYFPEQS